MGGVIWAGARVRGEVEGAGEWLGTYAPVTARLEWLRADGQVGLFTIAENDLTDADEQEHWQPGIHLLGGTGRVCFG